MTIVLASYGTRGDVEPCVAVGRELLRRGHDLRMAVSPTMVDFAESAGIAATAYGPDPQAVVEAQRNYWTCLQRSPWRVQELTAASRDFNELIAQCWREARTTLTPLADDADLLITGMIGEQQAANVAEYQGIPLATLHYFPIRVHGQLLPSLPASLTRSGMRVYEWLGWRGTKKLEDEQRRELGLPKAADSSPRRIIERGSLEIQAYDEACFPGLAAEWEKLDDRRPFVGALTMELPTDADDEVASWIAAGTPPIYFGFGSFPVKSPTATIAMIGAACAELGERALVYIGGADPTDLPYSENVKLVGALNHAAIFPTCRAVVHHGGSGTTAAGLRAGVPTLILWTYFDQPLWGAQLKKLKVGTSRRFSSTTRESLVTDLRTILTPEYVTRAREFSTRLTRSAVSVAATVDHLEAFALQKRAG